jgi:predicted DsbA family dithiol-disulfide isomerase
MGKKFGIVFNELRILSNSRKILEIGELVKEQRKFEAFHEKVFHAYFTEGLDIGSMDTILDIAKAVGLSKEEVIKSLEGNEYLPVLQKVQDQAQEYRISSTPTFIIDDKYAVIGAQPLEAFKEALRKLEVNNK